MPAETPKRLFLIDAMGYIFRAFYAPMPMRMRTATGIPTNVPYVFANMIRKLLKDWKPDYLGVVFDVSAPTFRDKLFAAYKAQRQPMPDELALQLPFVRRYCEAMRLPMIEYPGYEADDVIGTLSKQAEKEDLDVYIVTSDKDLMQLVGGRVRMLNPAKGDLLIDAKKVEELMGVPPSQVPDVMALMGDSIDNVPGARDPNEKPAPGERRKAGIGEVGARQLIQQYGSAEETLKHASEVKRANYREALEKYGEFVKLSKQLATIPTDAPVPLVLEDLKMPRPDLAALRELFVELEFTSLLREFAPVGDERKTDYAALDSHAALGKFLEAIPRNQEAAVWLNLDSEEPDDEGFGTRVLDVEVSTKAGMARTAANDVENKTLAAMKDWLADEKHPKIVHDPKLVCLLACAGCGDERLRRRRNSPRDSVVLVSAAAHHREPRFRRGSSAPPELHAFRGSRVNAPISCSASRPFFARKSKSRASLHLYEKIDLPLAAVLARMEAVGVRVDPQGARPPLDAHAAGNHANSRGAFSIWQDASSKSIHRSNSPKFFLTGSICSRRGKAG